MYTVYNPDNSKFSDNSEFDLICQIFRTFRIFNRVYSIRTYVRVRVTIHDSIVASHCQITKVAKKLRPGSCVKALRTHGKGAAFVFQAARSCVAAFAFVFRHEKSCVFTKCGGNLTKNFKFSRKKV